MSLLQSYAIWNNKGGVGKSTIAFHVAARYSEQHPNVNVLVIDLCPQANASMMLLGGGHGGEAAVIEYCTMPIPRTVVGYLSQVLSAGPGAQLPNPMDFLVRVRDRNQNLPDNLFVMCGDGNLEPMAPAISGQATQPPLTPQAQPWRWVHLVFRKLIEDVVTRQADRDWIVFVDTNPSFSIYTELAMCAANRLVTPVNADDSSRVATNAMFILLHGQNPPHPVYGSWTFAARAAQHQIEPPQIHLIVGNRLTQYGGAATAFGALSDATADTLFGAFQRHPTYFTPRPTRPQDVARFRDTYSIPLRDFNTAGVVAAHLGQRLSQLNNAYYSVHGAQVQVNKERVAECLQAVDSVVAQL
jgi:cellulose biosynthesis protein BcsQ